MTVPTITLREMTPDEYDRYTVQLDTDFVESMARASGQQVSLHDVRAGRTKFLPDGVATDGHRLVVIENGFGEQVGYAWIGFADPTTGSTDMAWLHYIHIFDRYRRAGYASAALAALETLAQEAGASQLGLNVFGHNRPAIQLYETAGFRVASQRMVKRLT